MQVQAGWCACARNEVKDFFFCASCDLFLSSNLLSVYEISVANSVCNGALCLS